MENIESLTQTERVAKKLLGIAPDVTTAERKEFLTLYKEEGGISAPTLSRYLNGNISNLETAVDILVWFSAKIKVRERKLEDALK